jgi:methyl-accepting chemotaxis protein
MEELNELSELRAQNEKLKQEAIAYGQQKWVDKFLSKFEELLRQNANETPENFSHVILEKISQETNAVSGIFYLMTQEEKYLKAAAGYAVEWEKTKNNKFNLGEGMIGQTAKNRKITYFENLPTNSVEVVASSVKIAVNTIVILPLIYNDKAFGVIELIYIEPVIGKYRKMFEPISKSIAAMLQSIFSQETTKALLQESKEQTEQLRAQEEEMRQNLEELSATQESLDRQRQELIATQEIIQTESKKTRAIMNASPDMILNMRPDGTILEVNQTLLDKTGYDKESLINQPVAKILPKDEGKAYAAAMEQLQAAHTKGEKAQPAEGRIVDKDGNTINAWVYLSIIDFEESQLVVVFIHDRKNELEIQADLKQNLEETKAQEEELRQNFEELAATQETLDRQKRELEEAKQLNEKLIEEMKINEEDLQESEARMRKVIKELQGNKSEVEELKARIKELETKN